MDTDIKHTRTHHHHHQEGSTPSFRFLIIINTSVIIVNNCVITEPIRIKLRSHHSSPQNTVTKEQDHNDETWTQNDDFKSNDIVFLCLYEQKRDHGDIRL